MPVPQPISPLPNPRRAAAHDLLETWKEIAAYLNRDLRTVKRWERSRGLPVHRLPGGPKAAVYALKSEVESWRQGAGRKAETAGPSGKTRRWSSLLWAGAAGVFLVAAGLVQWRLSSTRSLPVPIAVPLTSYRGVEWFPAFSPDGRQIAFSWNGGEEDNFDIYVHLVKAGNPLRLTTNAAMDLGPAWSPDGRHIAFARWHLGSPKFDYLVIPALGGGERRVAEGSITPNAIGIPFPLVAWTPDGQWLILNQPSAEAESYGLRLVSLETSESWRLTDPPPESPGDCCPVVSPDGRTLAFLRASAARTPRPLLLDIAHNGEARGQIRLLDVPSCWNPMWVGDGSELLCVIGDGEVRALWRIPVRGKGAAQYLPSIGQFGHHLALSPRGDRMISSNFSWAGDVWQLDLRAKKPPLRLIASTADDLAPQFSPDGNRLAFLSRRSGRLKVWTSDKDGSNALALVQAVAPHAPAWIQDGQEIAYTCRVGANREDICAINASGGTPRRLTTDPARDIFPTSSRDGTRVYFTSDRTGSFQIWRMPADESGPAIQVTRNGGFGGVESVDGRFLFYAKDGLSGPIWRVLVHGGDEVSLGEEVRSLRLPQNFAVGERGIVFASSDNPAHGFEIRLYRFTTGRSEPVARVKGRSETGWLSPRTNGRSCSQRSNCVQAISRWWKCHSDLKRSRRCPASARPERGRLPHLGQHIGSLGDQRHAGAIR
jgi:Tol biopolymer transport system component